ncbi:nucleotide exchange factor GrpE [Streptomyces sp. PSKA54]|uniref:Protein GrpE n=1 Tax=Streptomyces himalayensis subsp. aureolus TaxID=2758039 RepID=A0A7W2CX34_9ACTN|nr:nucleotide exchange factor GrpE [Streptomyces himalayensis]MBA4860712.1 nucleotide exchange factor GrpE [Streptomyces himalayensis subsp. aureolus]
MNQPHDHQSKDRLVLVRDKRRIDPVTLQPRYGDADGESAELAPPVGPGRNGGVSERPAQSRAAGPAHPQPGGRTEAKAQPKGTEQEERTETEVLRAQLQERTADLQRLKAEYDNYRKRVQRDRLAVREIAVANVLAGLLPVLDAVQHADEAGEVTGGFRQVTDALQRQLAALGLESFGRAGELFDPALHEAVAYDPSDRVDRPTCAAVHRPGYRVGGHLLRPAQVTVAEPPPEPPIITEN